MITETARETLFARVREQFLTPGNCGMVKPDTPPDDLMRLLDTPKGIEHCCRHNLPTLDLWTALRTETPPHHYIEAGRFTLRNPGRAVLVGAYTEATITTDGTAAAHIVLLHGATAHVTATGYSTITIDRAHDTTLTITERDFAAVYDHHYK